MSLGLLGSYYSSSSDSEHDDNKDENGCDKNNINANKNGEDEAKPQDRIPKLANPFLHSASKYLKPSYMVEVEDLSATQKDKKLTCEGATSVFNNPFRAKEERKKAILEQHVAMTTKQEDQKRKIGNRKICWNFRKGRCRFGSKCTFAHDNDVALAADHENPGSAGDQQKVNYSVGLLSDHETQVDPMQPSTNAGGQQKGAQTNVQQLKRYDDEQMKEMFEPNEDAAGGDDSDRQHAVVISNNKRKVRPGLGDDVVPGKKAMKYYNKLYSKNNL